MLMPLQKRQVFLWKSSAPMMFDLILDGMNGFWPLRDAHPESAITLLPLPIAELPVLNFCRTCGPLNRPKISLA